ncbi:MAG: hypothetical protein H0A76_12290 [Candidatus Thiodubiliella endoseptemdiera]|uniref:Uncharacterized protein n=1 Tax=Candidatus Thiodubiliella endoseptemdiera TaxID=2738886 RepID=A0A853F4X9_9GAMM|nr:hypothetical protein [Candidatus Thiodubiliella endoseptemdiera]
MKAGSVEDLSNFGSMIEKLKGKVGNGKEAERILLPIDFVLNSMDGKLILMDY